MTNNRQILLSKLRRAMKDRESSEKFWEAMTKARANRAALLAKGQVDIEAIKESNKALKTASVANGGLVEEFAENVRKNGGKVFLAKTGEDAMRYVEELSKRVGAKLIVKAKSLTSDEIEFTHELDKVGIRSVETDLGELIIQLAGETPVHLVMPAAHKSVKEIAKLVSGAVGKEVPPEDQAILGTVRAYLRQLFLTADIGVSGANIGVAETGSIVIETNEGNGRLVTSLPNVHLVIIGMEKIVPKWEDATYLVKGHSASATGQNMTVYVSVITQHGPLAGSADGREYHVIILDNGRSRMRDDPWFSDALNCIRCGACMNVCPTYGIAGGHTFGYIYPGPIGIPWTAEVHGLDRATFAHLCVSCGLCKEICPVDINIPMMIAKVKEEEVTGERPAHRQRLLHGLRDAREARKCDIPGLELAPPPSSHEGGHGIARRGRQEADAPLLLEEEAQAEDLAAWLRDGRGGQGRLLPGHLRGLQRPAARGQGGKGPPIAGLPRGGARPALERHALHLLRGHREGHGSGEEEPEPPWRHISTRGTRWSPPSPRPSTCSGRSTPRSCRASSRRGRAR